MMLPAAFTAQPTTLLLNLQEVLVGKHASAFRFRGPHFLLLCMCLPDAVPGTVVIEQLSGRGVVKTVRAGHMYVPWADH